MEKTCKNCRYYSQHYVKSRSSIHRVDCGHCLNRNNSRLKPRGVCEYWESIEIKKEERKKAIKETLDFIAKKLDEIAMILKNDTKI